MSSARLSVEFNDALSQGYDLKDSTNAINLSKTTVKVPALTVTGASTLTGNVTASGTLTVTGNTTFTGNLLPTIATATASAGAATATGKCGVITTEALTTAQNVLYTLTLTLTGLVTASVPLLASVANGTNTAGTPMIGTVTRTDANTLTIVVINKHATAVAFNGTLIISYWILG